MVDQETESFKQCQGAMSVILQDVKVKQRAGLEDNVVIQVGCVCGQDQVGSHGSGEEWSYFGYILKVEITGFVDGPNLEIEEVEKTIVA